MTLRPRADPAGGDVAEIALLTENNGGAYHPSLEVVRSMVLHVGLHRRICVDPPLMCFSCPVRARTDAIVGLATGLTVAVEAPATTHELPVRKVEA